MLCNPLNLIVIPQVENPLNSYEILFFVKISFGSPKLVHSFEVFSFYRDPKDLSPKYRSMKCGWKNSFIPMIADAGLQHENNIGWTPRVSRWTGLASGNNYDFLTWGQQSRLPMSSSLFTYCSSVERTLCDGWALGECRSMLFQPLPNVF